MAELKALLFDVDGTLADTEKDGHRVAFNLAFAAENLDWHWDEALYGKLLAVTGGKERIQYYLSHFNTEFAPPEDLTGFIKKLHQLKTDFYTQLLAEGAIPLRPGVARLIAEAREAGMRLAIVTTTTPANVHALLTHTLGADSADWFDVIAAGDIVPAKKPAPDIYDWALAQMGLTADETIAFEDSRNGILSSRGAGIKTLVTINDYTQEDDFSAAEIVLNHLGEPNMPFAVLAGNGMGHTFVDLAMVSNLAKA